MSSVLFLLRFLLVYRQIPFSKVKFSWIIQFYCLEETSVPPPTKRRLRGGLAAKPPVLETAKTAPAPVVKTDTVIEEPQKAQDPIEAPAAVAPKRKFFKSKAAAAAPKSSTVAVSQPTTTTIKTEPNKIEFLNPNLKKVRLLIIMLHFARYYLFLINVQYYVKV